MTRSRPRIALTAGDPAGIGPEIVEKAAADSRVRDACDPVIYESRHLEPFEPGRVSARAGRAAYDVILEAVDDALAGRVDAIATAPVSKEAFALAGLPWRGHTDLLAHLTGSSRVAMMFDAPGLRVVLATVHIPLREVPEAITRTGLAEVIRLTARELPLFGCARPRIAVAGLNPHAGEHGLMGREDEDMIVPAVQACAAEHIRVSGPFPADTLFLRAQRGEFDAVVACYHDQGLIPVKLVAFGKSVNVTLGLPIVRTSVDHGTAFDIAGRGIADSSSMVHAVLLAAQLARARAQSAADAARTDTGPAERA
jgi:4-hydroxythreonine-4-phosphate dehydrogenase